MIQRNSELTTLPVEVDRQQPIRILVVEDDPEMLAIYTENFLEPEFQLFSVKTATEALELLEARERPFDVVIADKSMPGIILLRKIKNAFRDIRVIMVNGYGNWRDYNDSDNRGVCDYIDKPFKMYDLKKLVRSLSK